ncbi:MAG: T9SS type A sorting domain-containing protein, partial [bacterium]
DQTSFDEIGFAAGHGTTNEPHRYQFIDSTVNSVRIFYRLKQIDLDGSTHYSEPIHISSVTTVVETKPAIFMLYQNYPNPFNPATNISYDLPKTSFVSLKIFNMIGQEVATLVNGVQEAGFKSVTFDASALASGVYLYRIVAGSFIQTKKMILMK